MIEDFRGTVKQMVKKYRADAKYLGAEDMPEGNKPICVLIDRIQAISGDGEEEVAGRKLKDGETLYAAKLTTADGVELKKKMILNKTKLKQLGGMYGQSVDQWHGKPLWLVSGVTKVRGVPTACITIQNRTDLPKQAKQPTAPQTEETQPQMGDAAEGGAK